VTYDEKKRELDETAASLQIIPFVKLAGDWHDSTGYMVADEYRSGTFRIYRGNIFAGINTRRDPRVDYVTLEALFAEWRR